MALSSSFLLFIFLHFHLLLLVVAQSTCPTSFNCQNFTSLEFPLSDIIRPDCGLITMNCTDHPLIQLANGGTWYEILDNISSNKFHIRDRQLQNRLLNRSCQSFVNLSLPENPSTSFTVSPNLTMYPCYKGAHEEEMRERFLSYNCTGITIFYRDPANNYVVDESAHSDKCWKIQLPMNPNQHDSSDLFGMLTAEFTVEWNISADCMSCHERGGQCDTNRMNAFRCSQVLPRQNSSRNRLNSVKLAIGIVLGTLLLSFLVLVILWWKGCCSQRKDTLEYGLRGVNFQTSSFTYRQIKTATDSFSSQNKIGEGGFGPVYKGTLSDGTVVAVKQLSARSRQGNREFVTEIGMISAIQHPNLVKLYGCCVHGNNLLLIYEYMENNSLASALFSSEHYKLNMDWPTRHKICVGVARGLAYLHDESALKIVHRDIKASNVLLDGNVIPKISDFGLARLHEEDDTHISTRIAGTLGYMAPEYAMEGYLTDKADVYSFGVVLLEVVSGRANNPRPGEEFNLLGQAKFLSQNDNLMELVDPRLESTDKEEILATINIALICTNFVGAERPSMSTVVSMLTGSSTGSMSPPFLNMFHVRPPGQGFTLIPVRSKLMDNTS